MDIYRAYYVMVNSYLLELEKMMTERGHFIYMIAHWSAWEMQQFNYLGVLVVLQASQTAAANGLVAA